MIKIPVSIGEIIDKITILQIKQEKIKDPDKKSNVTRELEILKKSLETIDIPEDLKINLTKINRQLWYIEDKIRIFERKQDFGSEFVELARSVYIKNDQRAAIKRQINLLTGSELIEEKSYE
jgi:ribosome-interacting GTPase 1